MKPATFKDEKMSPTKYQHLVTASLMASLQLEVKFIKYKVGEYGMKHQNTHSLENYLQFCTSVYFIKSQPRAQDVTLSQLMTAVCFSVGQSPPPGV